MQNTVHFVLQAKGGIGKSFVSTLLAQHVLNETGAVRCFDTDQENTTFAHYAALDVKHVSVTNESRLIDPRKFDALMETLLTDGGKLRHRYRRQHVLEPPRVYGRERRRSHAAGRRQNDVYPYHRGRRRHADRYGQWLLRDRAEGRRHAHRATLSARFCILSYALGNHYTKSNYSIYPTR